MDSIDDVAKSNFFVGVLGLILKLKYLIFEGNQEETKGILKDLEKCKKHFNLIKNFSPLVAYYISFYSILYEFLYSENERKISDERILEFYNIFEEFLIFRKFNKK